MDADGDGTSESDQRFVCDGDDIVLIFDETGSFTNRYLKVLDRQHLIDRRPAPGEALPMPSASFLPRA